MTLYRMIATAALAAILLTACAAQPPTQPTPLPTQPPSPTAAPTRASNGNQLAGTAWVLVSIGPAGSEKPALPGKAVTLTFDTQGQAGGNGGCNSYGGSYTEKQGELTFGQLMSTLMACADNAVTQQEQAYLNALGQAAHYEISGDQLVITSADGQTRLIFARGG